MSNTYTHVAFSFDIATDDNADRLLQSLALEPDIYVEVERGGAILSFTSEEAPIEALVDVLHRAMQSMPDVLSPQGFEWGYSADKPRSGDCGGGAVVIRRGSEPEWIETGQWLSAALGRE
jgi:hypothetical protein